MPASHLHSLNQLAGKETEPQGLCQAAGEPPIALLVGLKEASCFNFGKPCQRLLPASIVTICSKVAQFACSGASGQAHLKPPDCRDMRLSSMIEQGLARGLRPVLSNSPRGNEERDTMKYSLTIAAIALAALMPLADAATLDESGDPLASARWSDIQKQYFVDAPSSSIRVSRCLRRRRRRIRCRCR
jgi:hypothetical protein